MLNRKLFATAVCAAALILPVLCAPSALAQVTQQWVAQYHGFGGGSANAIAVDGAGHVYVTGTSVGPPGNGLDYATVAYDSNGSQLWARTYNGPGYRDDYATGIAVDGLGHVYVTGYSWGVMTGYDYATVAYDSNGNFLWVRRYNGPGNGDDHAKAIAVDGAGNVYVTGDSDGGSDGLAFLGQNYATVAYDSTGSQLWVARNTLGLGSDYATAIAVDGAGHVYVTGSSLTIKSFKWIWGNDYVTVAYDATNGAWLWGALYSGPGNGNDYARAIAVDGAGQVYVTGKSWGGTTDYDYATVAYDSTGSQLWARTYNGPVDGPDIANAIAVDGVGHVYVTGQSRRESVVQWDGSVVYYNDYATVAYDSTGNFLWEKSYNTGYGDSDNAANAIAVDGVGHVYVTGTSGGTFSEFDYATVAYDSTGQLLWVARYITSSIANAITVDSIGNVYVTGSGYVTIKYSQP